MHAKTTTKLYQQLCKNPSGPMAKTKKTRSKRPVFWNVSRKIRFHDEPTPMDVDEPQVNTPTQQPRQNNLSKQLHNQVNSTDNKSTQHPFSRAKLELQMQISPSPEPGKAIFYAYEYSLLDKEDDDWNTYLQLYDDEALPVK